MTAPCKKYRYRKEYRFDSSEWCKYCAEEPDEPLMRQQDAVRLEHLYDEGVSYTAEQHQENIRFLERLLVTITYAWSWKVRQKANMASLVEDYKQYFGLESKTE